MENTLVNTKNITEKLKDLKINYGQYYCQILYEDLEDIPYMEIIKLCKCDYQQKINTVYFENGTRQKLDRNCFRKFKICFHRDSEPHEIYFCGVFNDIEDVKNSIKIFNRNLDKCFDKLIFVDK